MSKGASTKVFMWQNNMCITYTMVFKQFHDYFKANGWEVVKQAEEADWIVVGACAGFLPQIEDYIKKMKVLSPIAKRLAIYGCLPKVTPQQFKASTPNVDLHIPTTRPQDIEKLIPNARMKWEDLADPDGFRREDYRNYDPGKKYIIIQYGCDANCVYCPHIIGMGRQTSRPRDRILCQARRLIDKGAHTLFLEGMDSGSWGTDLKPTETYLDLINPILEIPGNFEVHIDQFGSNWVLHYGDALLEAFSHPKVTDIKSPIQSTSPRILRLMGRDPRVVEIGPFLKALRKGKSGKKLNLRTDLIIGFPSETEEELQDTLVFAREHFDEVACYGFEIHPNTPIAKSDINFFNRALIEKRVQHATAFLEKKEGIITHRGGQVFETLVKREKRREQLDL